ncbi:mechanosensitive ion channel family protein [Neptunomonas antarctica]|uniref:Small-conductance mechanosensitive channel n=1 Tax=Neptunomonas antarctica TaxID=619304 RepID=A0A1N7M3Z8_9GAMM|nr:mechanosensitive ion channel family protein [Neptunomonas antarctica]SIS80846.1 BON domain-containing protein [Neptunomonas antarctica]
MSNAPLRLSGHLCWLFLFLLCSGSLSVKADSQPALEPALQAPLENTERVIDVDKQVKDAQIQSRIEGILTTVDKYTSLSVEARQGLVFLEGRVTDEHFVGWATDIAKNTQGVVAVINNISPLPKSVVDMAPVRAELTRLWYASLKVLPMVVIGFVVLIICIMLARPLAHLLMKPFSGVNQSQLVQVVVSRTIMLFIILFGFYFFLRIAGLTQVAVAIISGTGVIGLVVGFAFKDIAENFIASLLLSVQRPFQMGDVIEISSHKGVVQKMTARATTLVDFNGNHIQIPNATIYTNVIKNWTANPLARGSFVLGIGYDASIRKSQSLALKVLIQHDAVLADPEPQVLVESLGSSTINLRIYYWVDQRMHSGAKVGSIMMRLIMRELERHGISMPDDSREIIFPQGVPVVMKDVNDVKEQDSTASSPLIVAPVTEPSVPFYTSQVGADLEVSAHDDLSSDTDDIRQQAAASRDPEQGKNIL